MLRGAIFNGKEGEAMYDLVIKGGTVVTSKDSIKTDLAVKNGSISAIGDDLTGESVIDAREKLIMPGCIDSHTPYVSPGWDKLLQ